jgi:type 1 glutamine amidotransferase
MKRSVYRAFRVLAAVLVLTLPGACGSQGNLIKHYEPVGDPAGPRVLFLAGRDSHGPWAHEHKEGSLLLAKALHEQHPDYSIDVVYGGWPQDASLFAGVDALVFYCDGGKGHMIVEHVPAFEEMLEDNVGVVALHYAVEVPKGSRAATAMLNATGGYFETDWSVNPHWEASFRELPRHAVTKGVSPFSMNDEWYFNMRFVPETEGGVLEPVLTAIAPMETMARDNGPHSGNDFVRTMVAEKQSQVVAWAYTRPGGGRGFGYTGGHYHANWEELNATQLVINAIAWSAQGRER